MQIQFKSNQVPKTLQNPLVRRSPQPVPPEKHQNESGDLYAAGAGAALGLVAGSTASLAVLGTSPFLSAASAPGTAVGAALGITLAVALGAHAGRGAANTPRWGEDVVEGFLSRRMRQSMVKASQAETTLASAGHGARLGTETGAVLGAATGLVAGLTNAVSSGFSAGALLLTAGGALLGAAAGAAGGAALGCAAGPLAARTLPTVTRPRTVTSLDLNRYLGDWYEIARYPNVFQREPEAARQSFSVVNGKVEVVNTGFDPRKGSFRAVAGKTWLPDPAEPGKFKVSFAPGLQNKEMLGEDYWVLDLDSDYRWVAVGDPTRSFLWIMSRDPKLDPKLEADIRQRLQSDGWDLKPLQASPAFPQESK
ncbi:lipocalin family protein [bacterium]|nr:lipocalin family protein [bacterium]